MTYRRISRYGRVSKEKEEEEPLILEKRHSRSDTFYNRNVEDYAKGTSAEAVEEFNLTKDDWPDGVSSRWKVVEPRVHVENYTSDAQPDKRRICRTCINSRNEMPVDLKSYLIFCHLAFILGSPKVWKHEAVEATDTPCRDWEPKNQDCIA